MNDKMADTVVGEGVPSLDTELLQLNEVSSFALKSNVGFVEKIFDQWLSLPDTDRLVLSCHLEQDSTF